MIARPRAWEEPATFIAVCALLTAAFICTTGHGIYSFGKWRVWVVAAAVGVSVLLGIARLLGREVGRPVRSWYPLVCFLALAAGAVWGNWRWAGDPKVLKLLKAVLRLLAGALVLWAAGLAWARFRRRPSPWGEGTLFTAFLIGAAVFYTALIITVPTPNIDVWDHMNKGAEALRAGKNPYSTPIPDYYKGTQVYGFDSPGFPYPPAVVLTATAAAALKMDVRLMFLGCILVAAALVRATARRAGWSSEAADLIGALFLFVPRQSFLVKYAHSEPVTVLLLAAACYALVCEREIVGLLLLGAFASSKQYLVVLGPLLLLYARTPRRIAWMAGGAAALWIPFALMDLKALWRATFETHWSRPARKDALTINAWRMAHKMQPLARWIGLVSGLAMALAHGLRGRLRLGELGVGMACTLFVTLFLGPQAFANYYVLVAWVLLIAVATLPHGRAQEAAEASAPAEAEAEPPARAAAA